MGCRWVSQTSPYQPHCEQERKKKYLKTPVLIIMYNNYVRTRVTSQIFSTPSSSSLYPSYVIQNYNNVLARFIYHNLRYLSSLAQTRLVVISYSLIYAIDNLFDVCADFIDSISLYINILFISQFSVAARYEWNIYIYLNNFHL